MSGTEGDVRELDAGSIDALYTDMGDVLVKVRGDRFFEALASRVGWSDRQEFVDRVLARSVYRDFATGVSSPLGFAEHLAAILGTKWSFEQFSEIWVDMFDELPGSAEGFDIALAHVPVYILSNTDPVHWAHLCERFEWLTRATGTHMSFDVGLLKPDHRYYTTALEAFGHEPDRVLFIDDRSENVTAAREVGMAAVHMTDDSVFESVVRTLWGEP